MKRAVKLVTEASACIMNISERDGYIMVASIKEKITRFESNKDFLVLKKLFCCCGCIALFNKQESYQLE